MKPTHYHTNILFPQDSSESDSGTATSVEMSEGEHSDKEEQVDISRDETPPGPPPLVPCRHELKSKNLVRRSCSSLSPLSHTCWSTRVEWYTMWHWFSG